MLYKRLYIILLIFLFAGCSKDKTTPLFGEKPEIRVDQVIKEYKAALTGSTYGWKTVVYPPMGGGYGFYFRFGTNDRVTMFSDVSVEAASTSMESTYRLKAVQRPSLSFDTYNYLHLLADPDPNVYNGEIGQGYVVDFEYAIDTVSADTIKLTGITYETKMILIKATQAEAEAYAGGNFGNLVETTEEYIQTNPWLYLQFEDGKKLQVAVNTFSKTFTITYIDDADKVQLLSTAYHNTTNGIYLETPISYKGNTFQELFWDSAKEIFYVTIDGQRVEVKVAPAAVIPMHRLLGVDFTSLIVPPQQLPGWSTTFTNIYLTIANSMPFNLTLYFSEFDFNVNQHTMNLNVYVIQNNALFLAQYPYTYTETNGKFKFTIQPFNNPNAAPLAPHLEPLLKYIRNDHFMMELFADTQQGNGILGQLKSVENPDFFFTGFRE